MKVAIFDDNDEIVEQLKKDIAEYNEAFEIVGNAGEEEILQQYIDGEKRADIILMDIQLDQKDGIEQARKIQEKSPETKLIFITGYIEYARKIFQAHPVYFLVKPISKEALREALERATETAEEKEYMILNTKKGLQKVDFEKILYVESKMRQLYIHEKGAKQNIYMKLDEFMENEHGKLLRCHKSYAVNMDHIEYFSADGIVLEGDIQVPVSRSRYKEAKKIFLAHCGSRMLGE